ncbi:GNAT family N-acetyltransferase [Enterovirga sp.]|jgi:predicted GNAT family acetyltransferase|uniref:GNAT family N-acetyltransferase n=1 Tax=Enterovirga sp. TaxID=2026350 RepID=UPI00260B3284|nr:GNAT family N-acetyltransferase [Enterovirga sp.]MDB5591796.1 N-acetyltransferase [Enterovirga sp.]
MVQDSTFQDSPQRRRFELTVGHETAWADYVREPGLLVIRHVYAPPPLRGTGASDRLMSQVAATARQEGRRIVPLCGYAGSWLRAHSAHRDLVAG